MQAALRFGMERTPSLGEAGGVQSSKGFGIHYKDPAHPVVNAAMGLVSPGKPQDILDMAAGRGILSLNAAEKNPQATVLALDIDAEGLKEIDKDARAHYLPVATQVFDITSPQLPEAWKNRFDVVFAKDVYPFLNPNQIKRFLKNAVAALKPGGSFVITAPSNYSQLFQEASAQNGHKRWYQKLSEKAKAFIPTTRPHFSFTSIASLTNQLQGLGLRVTQCFSYGRAQGWLAAVAYKEFSPPLPLDLAG